MGMESNLDKLSKCNYEVLSHIADFIKNQISDDGLERKDVDALVSLLVDDLLDELYEVDESYSNEIDQLYEMIDGLQGQLFD